MYVLPKCVVKKLVYFILFDFWLDYFKHLKQISFKTSAKVLWSLICYIESPRSAPVLKRTIESFGKYNTSQTSQNVAPDIG